VGSYRERSPEVRRQSESESGGESCRWTRLPGGSTGIPAVGRKPTALVTIGSLRETPSPADSAAGYRFCCWTRLARRGGDAIQHVPDDGKSGSLSCTPPLDRDAQGSRDPHRAVVRLVRGTISEVRIDTVYLQLAPLSFDNILLEIWGDLLKRRRIVIPRRRSFAAGIGRRRIGRYSVRI